MRPAPDSFYPLISRLDLPVFLNAHGLVGEGAEIGTYYGEFAAQILGAWQGKRLHCIDPWRAQDPDVYLDGCTAVDWEEVYGKARAVLEPDQRAHLLRMLSEDAASLIRPETLDFVYIDSNHSYRAVKADLKLWWPKVKAGGLVGGHDAYSRHDSAQDCGVLDAVWDWSERLGVRPWVTPCTSWWFWKT
jgi:hypothetical protein